MFCDESLGKIWAKFVKLFRNGSVREFYSWKALITEKQVNTAMVEKDKILYEQNFDGDTNWSGIVNLQCVQMSLMMNMWFIFWRSLKRRATFITFLLFGNDVFSLISRPLFFVNFYKRAQSIQEQVNILNNTRPSIK